MTTSTQDSDFVQRVVACFAPKGPLSKATSRFVSRHGQTQFAKTVARAIENSSTEVIEAGTGTGKTFAYLTPALLAGCKVIVSTAGKPLQDQLFKKDLPAVEEALGIHAQAALLKGRANYICWHRLRNTLKDGLLPSAQAAQSLKRIEAFAETDPEGDKSNVKGVAEDDVIWPYVTSTQDNCLGLKKCPYADECFVYKARAKAKEADIVVVNHHLFLSAMAIKDEAADADMLPAADMTILDEAHKLPEIAANFFGSELSTFAIKENVKDIQRMTMSRHRSMAPKDRTWDELCQSVVHTLMDFGVLLQELGLYEGDSKNIEAVVGIERAGELLQDASDAMDRLRRAIAPLVENDPDLEKAAEHAGDLLAGMRVWSEALAHPQEKIQNESGVPVIRWISRSKTEARLHETPISFAEDFARLRSSQPDTAWVFTSATLATEGNNFSHFLQEMGLSDVAQTHVWASPFDFENQAMLYVPERLPDPKQDDRESYIEGLIAECWPVIDLIEGRTFVLCTSYRAMTHAGEVLRRYVSENRRHYEVYVQGEDNRSRLIENFRKHGNAILVGTMSFWEGIDIKGEALSLVIIDKLPFAPQGDPVLEAKNQWIRDQGGDPFQEHQIPLAAIALKQGTGRLIRSESDRGVLVIGDRRVLPNQSRTRYGDRFLRSLPGYSRTRRFERVVDFWTHPDSWV